MRPPLLPLSFCIVLILAACSPAPRYTIGRPPSAAPPKSSTGAGAAQSAAPVDAPKAGTKLRGVASYYADDFHGKKTSNGEVFDMYGLTAAHRTLPFNTWLEVKNLANGRTVIVRINDRGPFIDNRIIDLSYGAARELHMLETGVQEVELVVLR